MYKATAVAAAVVGIGTAVVSNIILLVGPHFSAYQSLCVDVARCTSAVGDSDARCVCSDAGRVSFEVAFVPRVALGA